MSRQLERSDSGYCRLKTNREENLTKYAGSTYAYAKKVEKIGRANDEKSGEWAEKARPMVENEKHDPFSF